MKRERRKVRLKDAIRLCANSMLPFILNVPVMSSSARRMVTFDFGFASPPYREPVLLRSIVQMPSSLSEFL